MIFKPAAALATAAFVLVACATPAPEPRVFTPEVAETLKTDMRAYVDRGNAPGIITYVVEDGEVVLADAYGVADVRTGAPMQTDTMVRIASLTKPITTVAMLMLYEEGAWDLDDPITDYIPEFADLKVVTREGELIDLERPPTMAELLTHTAGFVYGLDPSHPADRAYQASNALDSSTSMDVMIDKLADVPLKHQPGTVWEYSVAADIQGALVERLSGQPFAEFLRERIFEPLDMPDTDFFVHADAVDRMAALHAPDPDAGPGGGFIVPGDSGFAEVGGEATTMPGLPSGGGGLWSTVEDYSHFLEMLLDGGVYEGRRLLKPETVELMLTDQLPEGLTATASVRQAGFGFGLAIAASQDVSGQALPEGMITWPGIFGVYWWADRENDLIVFTVMQVPVTGARGLENLGEAGPASVYGALDD